MGALSPAKFTSTLHGGEWFRLFRTDDGLLHLESILDETKIGDLLYAVDRANKPLPIQDPSAAWMYKGGVPPRIARQLTDDNDPDQVAMVLDRAIRTLGYA